MSHIAINGLRRASQQQQYKTEEDYKDDKIDKQAVLYLHKPDTDYQCQDCTMFIAKTDHCSIHGPDDVIRSYGSCGFFVPGDPMPDSHPMGYVTKEESGYTENHPGFSCKRCQHFMLEQRDCRKVEKTSRGDDPGEIHPDACCNNWKVREE